MILSWLMSDYVVHSLNLKGLVAIRRSRSHIAVKPIRDRLKKYCHVNYYSILLGEINIFFLLWFNAKSTLVRKYFLN